MINARAASSPTAHRWWIIGLTLFIALVLMTIPMPNWLIDYRPNWLMLVLIFWAMMLPERVGIGTAWICGLLLDALQGTLLGENALMCVLVVFVTVQLHQRLRLFLLIQQCVFIFLLLGIQFIIVVWIQGISGQPIQGWHYGIYVVTSALFWPLIYGVLRWLQILFAVR